MSVASDEFARAVLKKSVAKVCVELGYSSINGSSLEVMLDLLEDFFRKFGFLMRVNAEDYNERCYNESEDAFYALDQLGMSVEELFSCVRDFNPGTLPIDIPLFPVPLDEFRAEQKLSEREGFFDPSVADEDDIRAAIEADQSRQALRAKTGSTPSKLNSTPPNGQPRSAGKRTPNDNATVSQVKPPTLNVSHQLTPSVSNSRQSVSPISAELAPVTVTGGGMLPTSVTLTYEESKDVSKTPILTPKKVAILKQNLLKKSDSSETTGESSTGTISRKLRLGIDAGVGSTPASDREKSPPPKESYVPEVTDVVSKSSAPIVPTSTTVSASVSNNEKPAISKKTQKEAQSNSAAPLVKTLPIPPPNAKAASAIDHETETGKVVEVKSGFVIKMDKSKVLPVLQFPAIPPPKPKVPKKKEAPPKMQIKLGTLLTEKQKIKLSAQILQEQEQIQGRSASQVKSEGSEESSEISSQFSQEEETNSEQFDDSWTLDSVHDISERLPEIPDQASCDLLIKKQPVEPVTIKVESVFLADNDSKQFDETGFPNQSVPEINTVNNSQEVAMVPKDEPQEIISEEQFRPTVISVKSCTEPDVGSIVPNAGVSGNDRVQATEHQVPPAYTVPGFRDMEHSRMFAEPQGSVNDLEDLRTPMIPDTPDLSTPREKFVAMFSTPLLPRIREENLPITTSRITSDQNGLSFHNDLIEQTDEGAPETPPEVKEESTLGRLANQLYEKMPPDSVMDVLESGVSVRAVAQPFSPPEITVVQPNMTNNQLQQDMTSVDVVDIGEETDAESDDEKPSSPNLDVLPTLKHTSELDALTSTDSNVQPIALESNIPTNNTTIAVPNIITIESDGEIEIPPSPNLIPLTPSTSNEIPRSPNLDADLNSRPNSVGPSSPQSSAEFNPAVATSSFATSATTATVPFQLMSQNLRAASDVSGPALNNETIQTPPSPNLIDETESRATSSLNEAPVIDTGRLDSVLDLGVGVPQLSDDVSVASYDSSRKTTDTFAEKEKSGKKRKHSSEHKSKKKHKKAKRELAEVEELDEDSLMGDEDDGMVPVLPKLILKFGGKSVTIGNESIESSKNTEQAKVPAVLETKPEPLPLPERAKTPSVQDSAPLPTKKPQSAKKQKEEQSMRELLAKAEMMHQATSTSVQSLTIKAPVPAGASGDLQSPITPVGIRDCDFTNTSPNLPPLVGTAPEYQPPRDSFNYAASTSSANSIPATSTGYGEVGGSDVVPGTDVIGETGSADQQVWICPACGLPDTAFDSPMIGCDLCDGWYHWQCLGILMEPTSEKWFCPKCMTKNNTKSTSSSASASGKKKGKKAVSKKR